MSRALLAAALVGVATALPAAANIPDSPGVPRLFAKVSATTISVTDSRGARASLLQQNTYRIFVSDSTKAQNFHLLGPGVNRKTRIAARASTSWTTELSPGRYFYRSDKSPKLRGHFDVKGPPPARSTS